MVYLIVLLTIILVLNCLFLGLLILVQLPKKEAGLGMAFGGGAADALFGAGSGTALTKLTKYSAVVFFGLVLLLCILNSANRSGTSDLRRQLMEKPAASTAAPAPAQSAPATTTTPAPAAKNNSATVPLTVTPGTAPATTAKTNAPAASPK